MRYVLARGEDGQPQVNISPADAGALLGFADLYPRMEGGVAKPCPGVLGIPPGGTNPLFSGPPETLWLGRP